MLSSTVSKVGRRKRVLTTCLIIDFNVFFYRFLKNISLVRLPKGAGSNLVTLKFVICIILFIICIILYILYCIMLCIVYV